MSEKKTIIILANSVRSGDRCIAGKEFTKNEDGSYAVGRWVRLADHGTKEGAVPARLAYCRNHGWVKNLDVVNVTLESRCNKPDHPDDWWLEPNQPWEFVQTRTAADVPNLADQPPALWYAGESDAVPAGYISKMGDQAASLYLFKPPEKWELTYHKEYRSDKGYNRKVRRLKLTAAGHYHDFSITDLDFDRRFKLPGPTSQWPDTSQPLTVPNPAGCYFCLSLTPEYNGKHYKICATIFET